jgi:ABC-type transport system substrate-binding protein
MVAAMAIAACGTGAAPTASVPVATTAPASATSAAATSAPATSAAATSAPATSTSPSASASASPPESPSGSPAESPSGSPAESPSGSPAESPSGSPSASASAAPTGTAYPEPSASPAAAAAVTEYPNYGGEIDCEAKTFNGLPYTGSIKKLAATDASTVVFSLCSPDPAFLAKIAFTSFAILDTDYLIAKGADQTIVTQPVGTGPYKLQEWRRGDQIILEANPDYWGTKAKSATAVIRWSSEPGQKLIELQSGQVDGVDNPSKDDMTALEGNSDLVVKPREGLNTFYLGFNNKFAPFGNEKVRQAIAQGIDRQALIDQFFPPGSEAASHFTPAWYDFDAAAAKTLLAEGLAEENVTGPLSTKIHLRVVDRTYLPFPEQVATAIQSQLKENLDITAEIDIQESGTYIDNADRGLLDGIHMLGWGADYPDPTNFLDFHFGSGASDQFGDKFPDVVAALVKGSTTADEAARKAAYTEANGLIKQHVPMIPISHAGSATAWRADVEGSHSSPLGNEALAVMGPGADDQLVFLQSGEPAGLYCADESDGEALRVCEQITEALYAYEIGGTASEPALAESCEPNAELSEWTCKIRQGVKFHDGSTLEANDVVLSYAVQWDNLHPLHKGRDGSFTYFPGLWGGFLNPPPPCGLPNSDPCEE